LKGGYPGKEKWAKVYLMVLLSEGGERKIIKLDGKDTATKKVEGGERA